MKFNFIRLLKAIGITAVFFAALFLFVFSLLKYTKIAAIIILAVIFVFVVWRVYEGANLDEE